MPTPHAVGADPDLALAAGDRTLFSRVLSEMYKETEKGDRRAISLLNPELVTMVSTVSREQCHT